MPVEITRKVEFDSGHRIPGHLGKCRHFHGHRYVLEVTVTGEISQAEGDPEQGMVVDFGNLKSLMQDVVADRWDHGFLVWEKDQAALQALAILGSEHKTVILPLVPTAENLSHLAGVSLLETFQRVGTRTRLRRVRLFETPNCWADSFYI